MFLVTNQCMNVFDFIYIYIYMQESEYWVGRGRKGEDRHGRHVGIGSWFFIFKKKKKTLGEVRGVKAETMCWGCVFYECIVVKTRKCRPKQSKAWCIYLVNRGTRNKESREGTKPCHVGAHHNPQLPGVKRQENNTTNLNLNRLWWNPTKVLQWNPSFLFPLPSSNSSPNHTDLN